MATMKKAILSLFIILLMVMLLAKNSFGVNTGKALEEVKLKKSTDDASITLEIIPKNDEFEILEEQGDWYRVNYQKIKGYVKKEQVEIINEDTNNDEKGENITNEESQKITEEQQTTNTNETSTQNSIGTEQEEVEPVTIGSTAYTNTELQVYLRPLLNSMKIETLKKNQEVTVVDIASKWAYVSVDGKTGWIRTDLLTTKKEETKNENTSNNSETSEYLNKTGYITSDGINFREEPSTDSKILKTFLQNAKVTILLEEGNWYKIRYNDQEGYVVKTYVSEKKVTTSRSSSSRTETTVVATVSNSEASTDAVEASQENTEETTNMVTTTTVSSKASQLVELAKKYVGYKYVYGGSTPSGGFDCSGFTMYLYSQFGVSLPHSATAQSSKGTKVDRANLQPGDIIFFKNYQTNTGIGHCGIYIGNNQFIHASTEKTGVITSSLSSSAYSSRYVTAVRIFN
jgi:cell wall-associated NlpC family hydrolase